jgi:excisionase family DNA binding protein
VHTRTSFSTMQAQEAQRKVEKAMQPATVQRRYLTYEQAAYYTNLSSVTLWRAVRDKRLKPAGPGRAVRFDKDELDRFMRSRGRD